MAVKKRRPVYRSIRRRRVQLLWCCLVVGICSSLLLASDPPHWSSNVMTMNCTNPCHVTHQASGASLSNSASNVNLCQSCHGPGGLASELPISTTDLAEPGNKGTSHAFDRSMVNQDCGAQAPQNPEMQVRTMGGNIVCSTCHNQHSAISSNRGTPRISSPQLLTSRGSTGTLSAGGTFDGERGSWYHVKILNPGTEATAEFQYRKTLDENDWSVWSSSQTAGVGIALDNGVTITFAAGSYELEEEWELYASWAFLRVPLDAGNNSGGDAFCRDCHRDWAMDHIAVRTYSAASPRSHPVGVALNANGRAYDRSVPLDADGSEQGAPGDGNNWNDLRLDSNNSVQCWTCHGVHFMPSRSGAEAP